jgi:hypothetical protein
MVAADRIHCLSCIHDDGLQNSKLSSASTKKVTATSMPPLLLRSQAGIATPSLLFAISVRTGRQNKLSA